jgi:hypothetical protein
MHIAPSTPESNSMNCTHARPSALARAFALAAMAAAFLAACGGPKEAALGLPPPAYAAASAWLALPGPASVLNDVPARSGLSDLQASAPADVFYVLPTTSTGNADLSLTAAYDDADARRFAVQVAKNQATAFNGAGRIFAPLYRGIKNEGWGADLAKVQEPLDLGYSDVKRAFDYYMAHYNAGRPIIFVSHSQGDIYVYRLLLEEFDGKPLAKQLVAAYVIGQPLAADFFSDYSQLKPCDSPDATGCLIGWCTFGSGTTAAQVQEWAYDQYYWIPKQRAWGAPLPPFAPSDNPLSWSSDGQLAPIMANMGSLPGHLSFPAPDMVTLPSLAAGAVDAQGAPAATFVHPAPIAADQYSISVNGQSLTAASPPFVYHYFDFNLFWMNIRANARERVNAHLRQSGSPLPWLTSSIAARGTVGVPLQSTVTTMNPATSFSASGLPPGLSIDPVSGTIGGTATSTGVFAVKITAGNAAGSTVGELALTLDATR